MAFSAPTSFTDPQVLKGLHALTTTALGLLTGIAFCLAIWVLPIVHMAPTTLSKCRQFNYIIHLGRNYLQPTSSVFPVVFLSLIYLSHSLVLQQDSRLDNASFQARSMATSSAWSPYVLALLCLVPIAPWETTLIFPTNDKIAEMTADLEKAGKVDFGDGRDEEVVRLLGSWGRWHWGRVVMPFMATGVMAWVGAGGGMFG